MKKLGIIGLFLVTVIFIIITACSESFLEKKPLGAVSPEVLKDAKGLDALLIAAYSELDGWAGWNAGSTWHSPGSNWVYGDVAADDAHKGSDQGDQISIIYFEKHEGLLPSNEYLQGKWLATYDGVSRANDVLRVLPQASGIDASVGTSIEAEAKFLRAFFHLEAIKMHDYVPYVDETNADGKIENQPASSAGGDATKPWSQMGGDGTIPWAQVEADFQFAVANLGTAPRNNEIGRATKYAAEGMLARVYMYQEKYAQALTLLNDIISSGKYSLTPNFSSSFSISGDNGTESVFAIQASVQDGDNEGNNANYGEVLNFPYNNGPGGCCGFQQPSQDLVNSFKTQNGLPLLAAFGLQYNLATDDVKNDMGVTSPSPFTEETRALDPRLDWTVGRRGIPYLDWGDHGGQSWIRDQGYSGPYAPKKLIFKKSEKESQSAVGNWGGGQSSNNFELIRYADVLLMAAECEVEANSNLSQARTYVNMIRARAMNSADFVMEADGVTPAANYVINQYAAAGAPFDSQANAREAVRFERRLELSLEGLRFWDLKRWGVLKSTLEAYWLNEGRIVPYMGANLVAAGFSDFDVRFPISQTALDRSEGTLHQVPGY